jgi:hypothetical protein
MKKYVSVIFAFHLVSMNLFAWTNGELLVWRAEAACRDICSLVEEKA